MHESAPAPRGPGLASVLCEGGTGQVPRLSVTNDECGVLEGESSNKGCLSHLGRQR